MHYVYILKSLQKRRIYIGCTSDLKSRIKSHNSGKDKATKHEIPWKLLYYEAYSDSKLALRRERNLKYHGKSLAMLKRRIGF